MNDFIREIQEDIERQKWARLWEKYGRGLVVVVSVIVLSAAGWQVMKYVQLKQHRQDTATLVTAMDAGKASAFETAAQQTSGEHQGLAKLVQAQLLEKDGKSKEAQAVLATLANENSDALPNDLARALISDGDKTATIFRLTALERAGWQAIEAGDYVAATTSFEAIAQAEKASPSLVDRAKAGLAYSHAQQAKQATPETSTKE